MAKYQASKATIMQRLVTFSLGYLGVGIDRWHIAKILVATHAATEVKLPHRCRNKELPCIPATVMHNPPCCVLYKSECLAVCHHALIATMDEYLVLQCGV